MSSPLRVAVLDLNNGVANQGLRSICDLLSAADQRQAGGGVVFDVFDVRLKTEVPSLDYDVYISSGGPGSPFEGVGSKWEAEYFSWLQAVWDHNEQSPPSAQKHALFICHSFQMMCRHFSLAQVTERGSESFGIFPVFKTAEGTRDPLLKALPDPFYAVDFRSWQAIGIDRRRLRAMGASVLALEKMRPHVAHERAVMAIRLSQAVVGVQFHPEANPEGMLVHFADPTRRAQIVQEHGPAKFERMLRRMRDPNYLTRTFQHLIPAFLAGALRVQRPELSGARHREHEDPDAPRRAVS